MPDSIPLRWQPASVWTPIAAAGRYGLACPHPGVRFDLEAPLHAYSITARHDRCDDLMRVVREKFGVALPLPGRMASTPEGEIVWSGPGHWLIISASAFPAEVLADFGHVASVTDQSGARALLRVSGPDARETLAKGFAIDLHPDVFTVGCAAVTGVAHMSVQIWQREEGCYTIAVPRSFASSFWAWLTSAAAIYGYEVAA